MISEAELIVDRRRLKRRVTFWRILAVLLGIATVAALAWSQGWTGGDQIARVRIDGLITGDQKTIDLLKKVADEDRVKAVILRIDSPGGTTAGSEAVYDAVRRISAKKPVVAVMDTVAASGGYITALAADRIVARGNTITGSIGVIFSMPEFSKLLDTVGVQMEELKSGDLKAEPSPYKPMSDKARAASMELVMDGFAWFKGLVAERRKLPMPTVDVLVRWPGLFRPPGGGQQAHRRAGRRGHGGRLDGTGQGRGGQASHPRLEAGRTRAAAWASASRPPTSCSSPWGCRGFRKRPKGHSLTGCSCFGTLPSNQEGAMIKSELVQKIAEKNPHLYHRDIERIVNTVLDEIINALKEGDRVELRGFGAFSAKARNARMGRNPRTGESVEVVAKRVPFFKTGKELRERLNLPKA